MISRFNQFLILLTLILIFGCIRIAVATESERCHDYGTEFKSNISDLRDLSQFAKKAEFSVPYVEFQYNGFSVSKQEYERLMLRDMNKGGDPGMRMP